MVPEEWLCNRSPSPWTHGKVFSVTPRCVTPRFGIRNCTWIVSIETHVHAGVSGEVAHGTPADTALCVHVLY